MRFTFLLHSSNNVSKKCIKMQKETFKSVPNYEGLYQVSNLGKVKSLDRFVKHRHGGKQTVKGRILKPAPNNKGYLTVSLNKEGKGRTFQVHQLVAIAFLGHAFCGYAKIVDHIDNDQLNNKVENLQLISQRENASKDRKGTSQFTGVCWEKGRDKWRADMQINGKPKFLGSFTKEIEAHAAYQTVLNNLK